MVEEHDYKDQLIFKGEYSNGIRYNGKVYDVNGNFIYELKEGQGYIKEFDSKGQLKFEGEYVNGKKNGKGKEYYDGKLIYNGEYLYGEKNGEGNEYNKVGKLIFKGRYLSELRWNGNGNVYDLEGNIKYEVNYFSGVPIRKSNATILKLTRNNN